MHRVLGGFIVGMAILAFGQAELTEVEKLKVQVHQLQIQLAQAQADADACRGLLGQYRAAKASVDLTAAQVALQAAIEEAHPGYTIDFRTGTLVKKGKEEE